MTLHFAIEYHTEWGETVEVELCFLSAGANTSHQRISLETGDGLHWAGACSLKARGSRLRYTYIITKGVSVHRREWTACTRILPADDARTYYFRDHWADRPGDSYRYTKAYRVASGIGERETAMVALFPRTFLFRVMAPGLAPGERVALVGEGPSLGDWDTARALPMTPSAGGEWMLSISAEGLRPAFQYKYVVMGESGAVRWEEGGNRQSSSQMPGDNHVTVLSDGEIRLASLPWRVAGLVVPLFSLRSEGSQGVGDLGDLREVCEWAASAGMHAVQLLPVHDTTQSRTPTDSYPYNAVSVHALHPIYADLRQLPLADAGKLASFRERWQKLNALPALDYVEVIRMKEEYLHLLYEEQGDRVCAQREYKLFAVENADWLPAYQVFCHLRDTFGTARFSEWPELSVYNQSAVQSYAGRHAREVGYYSFVQYVLHAQLVRAAGYARSRRVFLKGDLPIGISPCSVEAWQEPHLFHTDMAAGAPPDDFSPTGQNWGFPTYDWERMAADGYHWWRQRLAGMSRYFSAYRIDHILGFFRIWQIPKGSPSALLGRFSPALPLTVAEIEAYGMRFHEELFVADKGLWHPRIGAIGDEAWRGLPKHEQDAFIRLYEDFFYRRHNDFWAAEAMKKLPALVDASDMLVCGEDLGMVPACVTPVMQRLGILSLEIQSMPKTYGIPFSRLQDNPYQSVATIFTHDMPTLRLWWKEDAQRAQYYYNNVLGRDGQAPEELSGSLCEEIVRLHLGSPSMLCLISLQDWLSLDEELRSPHPECERINVPANPKHYWRYRMHLPISRLLEADALNGRLRTLIDRSGR